MTMVKYGVPLEEAPKKPEKATPEKKKTGPTKPQEVKSDGSKKTSTK